MATITSKEYAQFLEKVGTDSYVQHFIETVTDQVLSEKSIAGQESGATLTVILEGIYSKLQSVEKYSGVSGITFPGASTPEGGSVIITLAKLGIEDAITQVTTNKTNIESLSADVIENYAKKSDITALFRWRGTVNAVSELPTSGTYDATNERVSTGLTSPDPVTLAYIKKGDVYHVVENATEYVCSEITTAGAITWEELGPLVDLSTFATTTYVDEQVQQVSLQASANTISIRSITEGSFQVGSAKEADNATTAGKLAVAVTFTYTGDATGSVDFDGSGSVSCTLTLAETGVTAGTYSAVQVDAKGRVLAGQQSIVFAETTDDASLSSLAVGGIAIVGS